jgi:hypothetical protein
MSMLMKWCVEEVQNKCSQVPIQKATETAAYCAGMSVATVKTIRNWSRETPHSRGLQPAARAGCIMQPMDTFVNCVHTIRVSLQFRQSVITLIVVIPRAAREPAHNNGRGPLQYNGWRPTTYRKYLGGKSMIILKLYTHVYIYIHMSI